MIWLYLILLCAVCQEVLSTGSGIWFAVYLAAATYSSIMDIPLWSHQSCSSDWRWHFDLWLYDIKAYMAFLAPYRGYLAHARCSYFIHSYQVHCWVENVLFHCCWYCGGCLHLFWVLPSGCDLADSHCFNNDLHFCICRVHTLPLCLYHKGFAVGVCSSC